MRRPHDHAASRALVPLVGTLLALTFTAPAAHAKEWAPGKYLNQALDRVQVSVRGVTEKTKFGLDDGSTCFVGALLVPGKPTTSRIPLKAGVTYAFIGGGDDDVRDMDLYLKDADGNVVDKDEAKDANPVLVFTPPADGKYTVVMKLVDCKAKSSFCCYATLRSGGLDIPAENLTTATARLLELCEGVNLTVGNAWFHDGDGQLCMFGSILPEGSALTQSGFALDNRPYVFVGAADDLSEDIDLKVLSGDGTTLAQDDKTDAMPIVVYKSGGTVSLKLSNAKSKGAALCMAAAIKLTTSD